MNNTPIGNPTDNNLPDESGEWELTLYEPYHLPAESPYHRPAEPEKDGGGTEGWVLTVYEPYCLPVKPLG